MYWEIDEATTTEYNTKDNQGHKILWGGVPVNQSQKVKLTLEKRSADIKDVVKAAS